MEFFFLQKNWKLGLEIDVNELSACKLEAQDQVKMKKFVVFFIKMCNILDF